VRLLVVRGTGAISYLLGMFGNLVEACVIALGHVGSPELLDALNAGPGDVSYPTPYFERKVFKRSGLSLDFKRACLTSLSIWVNHPIG